MSELCHNYLYFHGWDSITVWILKCEKSHSNRIHFDYFLKVIWILKSDSSLKSPTHVFLNILKEKEKKNYNISSGHTHCKILHNAYLSSTALHCCTKCWLSLQLCIQVSALQCNSWACSDQGQPFPHSGEMSHVHHAVLTLKMSDIQSLLSN